jgi:hypothetical protein
MALSLGDGTHQRTINLTSRSRTSWFMLTRCADALFLLRAYGRPELHGRITFEEETHTYRVDGVVVKRSVTGLLKMVEPEEFDGPARAAAIAAKPLKFTDPEYLTTDDDGAVVKMTAQQIVQLWDHGRDLGTDLHAHIEQYVNAFAELETALLAVVEEVEDAEVRGPWEGTIDCGAGDSGCAVRSVRRRLSASTDVSCSDTMRGTSESAGQHEEAPRKCAQAGSGLQWMQSWSADDDDAAARPFVRVEKGARAEWRGARASAVVDTGVESETCGLTSRDEGGNDDGSAKSAAAVAMNACSRALSARMAVSIQARAFVRRCVRQDLCAGKIHLEPLAPYCMPLCFRKNAQTWFTILDALTIAFAGEENIPAAYSEQHENAPHFMMFRRYWRGLWLKGLSPYASELTIFAPTPSSCAATVAGHGKQTLALSVASAASAIGPAPGPDGDSVLGTFPGPVAPAAPAIVAGSVDFIAINQHTGGFVVIDWKRCKIEGSGFRTAFRDRRLLPPMHALPDTKLMHWSLQVNVYRLLLEAPLYNMPVEDMMMVVLMTQRGQTEAIEFHHSRDDTAKLLLDMCVAQDTEEARRAEAEKDDVNFASATSC